LLVALPAESSDPVVGARKILRRLSQLLRGRKRAGNGGRTISFRPAGEGLESKTLLSAVLGWSGGNGGNTNSLITPANISKLTEQYGESLEGAIVAQPLSATVNVTVGPNPGRQTLVFVATENDSLYAFNTTTGELEWKTSLLGPGEAALTSSITRSYTGGITSTPVIDPSTNTIYVVTTESYRAGSASHYSITLHAVDVSDGLERQGSPVVIADTGYIQGKVVSLKGPTVAGKGAGSVGGRVYFYVTKQLQRTGLSIFHNNVVIAFASYGDHPPYHGWILAYDKNSLRPTAVFNDTPNGSDGGIWNDGNPIQVDSQGFLYTETGNGTFDTTLNRQGFPSKGDYGSSVLRLAFSPGYKGINGTGIRVVDYFTPDNEAKLNNSDLDLASSGVLILPNGFGGPTHRNLLLASGKAGTIYVIDRSSMGKYHQKSNNIVQELPMALGGSFDTPAFFNNTVYYAGVSDVLESFKLVKGKLVKTGQSSSRLPWPGASPVVSSTGTQNGIIWVISSADRLIGYDPTNLSRELWTASIPGYSHFAIPTITDDGHVFVGADNVLMAFELDTDD
jgi:hypothetical protein